MFSIGTTEMALVVDRDEALNEAASALRAAGEATTGTMADVKIRLSQAWMNYAINISPPVQKA